MLSGPFALALVLGMGATVNPCGFALLPAYLSAFMSLDDVGGRFGAVGRALKVSLSLTAGFVAVFVLFGAVVSKAVDGIEAHLGWVTIVIGLALSVIGVFVLAGHEFSLTLPKMQRGGSDGTVLSMFLFGMSYATASLPCTVPLFLSTMSATFRTDGFLSGVVVFVMYGLGMGLVVTLLTVAVALARTGLVGQLRRVGPVINRLAGALLVVAGLYVAYYGWYELRIQNGFSGDDPVVSAASSIQGWMFRRIPAIDKAPWFALAAAICIGAAVAWTRRTRTDEPAS